MIDSFYIVSIMGDMKKHSFKNQMSLSNPTADYVCWERGAMR
jgi:hypothetical protein